MPTYLPFDPSPRRPSKRPPPRTTDSQFHVLGPIERYPIRPGAAYQMPTATWEAALRMHKTLGIERGVIVQTTTYGADHAVVLDGLAAMGSNYRGCANALVFAEATDAYLAQLDAAGVNGARFSFRQALGAVLSDKDFDRGYLTHPRTRLVCKISAGEGRHHRQHRQNPRAGCAGLIDHMGRPDAARGKDDPNLSVVLDLLAKGNFWVMLSLGEKTSKAGPPWDDVIPIARAYIEATPDRCVWAERLAASGVGGSAAERC